MGDVHEAGQAVLLRFNGGDHVQPQQGQVRQVVVADGFAVEMGVDQT